MTWEARPMANDPKRITHGIWMVGRVHPQLGSFEPWAKMSARNATNNEMDARYIAAALNDYDPEGEMYDREHSRVPAGLPAEPIMDRFDDSPKLGD